MVVHVVVTALPPHILCCSDVCTRCVRWVRRVERTGYSVLSHHGCPCGCDSAFCKGVATFVRYLVYRQTKD